MFGTAMRLLAAGVAGQRLGDYVKVLTTRYLMLAIAGIVFSTAIVFASLAAFWALNIWTQNPIWSALIMVAIFILASLSIALLAYGTTRGKPESVREVMQDPVQALQAQVPSVEDVGHQIELAVRRYGPVQVAAAAAAGGLIAGLLAKRFRQVNVYERRDGYEPRRDLYEPRRDGRGYGRYA